MIATALLLFQTSGSPPAVATVALNAVGITSVMSLLFFLLFLFETIARGGRVTIESRWAGLGGGLGGWTVSAALIYLGGAMFFGGATAVIAVDYLNSERAKASQQFDLQKAREADERKYRDAEKAREAEERKYQAAEKTREQPVEKARSAAEEK